MTSAVVRATYADFKLIKSRGVVQLVFEVPIHESDSALASVGGMPNPSAERWFAIARLTEQASQAPRQDTPPSVPKPAGAPKSYAQRIALLCKEPRFWRFIEPQCKWPEHSIKDEAGAAAAVRLLCDVASRSHITEGTRAGVIWRTIAADYDNWARGVVA